MNKILIFEINKLNGHLCFIDPTKLLFLNANKCSIRYLIQEQNFIETSLKTNIYLNFNYFFKSQSIVHRIPIVIKTSNILKTFNQINTINNTKLRI